MFKYESKSLTRGNMRKYKYKENDPNYTGEHDTNDDRIVHNGPHSRYVPTV